MSKSLNWSKPENLRLRDKETMQIIEIIVPTNDEILSTALYPVSVWLKDGSGYLDLNQYTLSGHFFSIGIEHCLDIIESEQ